MEQHQVFEINKIDTSLAGMIKGEKKEKRHKFYAPKFKNLGEIDQVLKRPKLLIFSQEEIT